MVAADQHSLRRQQICCGSWTDPRALTLYYGVPASTVRGRLADRGAKKARPEGYFPSPGVLIRIQVSDETARSWRNRIRIRAVCRLFLPAVVRPALPTATVSGFPPAGFQRGQAGLDRSIARRSPSLRACACGRRLLGRGLLFPHLHGSRLLRPALADFGLLQLVLVAIRAFDARAPGPMPGCPTGPMPGSVPLVPCQAVPSVPCQAVPSVPCQGTVPSAPCQDVPLVPSVPCQDAPIGPMPGRVPIGPLPNGRTASVIGPFLAGKLHSALQRPLQFAHLVGQEPVQLPQTDGELLEAQFAVFVRIQTVEDRPGIEHGNGATSAHRPGHRATLWRHAPSRRPDRRRPACRR